MSPTRLGYKKLGLKIIEPLKDDPHRTRWPHMVEEKKGEGVGDPIKLFLEKALARQMDGMMNNFGQILRRLSTTIDASTSSGHFEGMAPLWKLSIIDRYRSTILTRVGSFGRMFLNRMFDY
jgi:hypothetical protein